uniref:Interferon gamma n=2 Tax=Paralichthys olivaceus TaxID=8255 RepID=IFNG_PAROL|nr:PREDICTED: uncharacterized protein LOC109644000 [Paralichthys olivaceus]B3IXK1.1 RecName: Full=Interferon gamma; Flags: Precursor [Paralichthys olivaceus]BAG50577.1 interferon gamma [Paralichthys olivaceus]
MMVSTARAVVCLSLCLCVCQVRGSHIPARMNKTIQNLLQHYNISNKDRFNGKPVFPKEPLSGRMETKMLFMGGVLETYEKLIGQMLEQLPNTTPPTAGSREGLNSAAPEVSVRTDLNYILKKVQELRTNRFKEQSKLLQGLHDLGDIKMNNFIIQSKALWELQWMYEEASSLSNNTKMQRRRRRRRRQARKVKTPTRA